MHAQESIISPLDRRSEAYRHQAAAVAEAEHLPKRQKLLTIPNVLTLARLIMVPIIILLWEWSWRWSPITAALVFIGASLTDWLDGYLARRVSILLNLLLPSLSRTCAGLPMGTLCGSSHVVLEHYVPTFNTWCGLS